jgi:hypothetical protein
MRAQISSEEAREGNPVSYWISLHGKQGPVIAYEEEPSNINRRLEITRVPLIAHHLLTRSLCPSLSSAILVPGIGVSRSNSRGKRVGGEGGVKSHGARRRRSKGLSWWSAPSPEYGSASLLPPTAGDPFPEEEN